jgi:hypothetical protein
MEPGQVLVALLYLWLLVAIGVYGWRAYRRIVHHETRRDRDAQRAAALLRSPEDAATTGTPRPPVTAPAASPEPPVERTPLAELVEGISLPCGLLPLVTDDTDPHRALFTTTGHAAATIATAVADELARLGFEVQPVDDTESVARRGGSQVRVRVHPDGPATRALFPRAPDHSVVAELTS